MSRVYPFKEVDADGNPRELEEGLEEKDFSQFFSDSQISYFRSHFIMDK